MALAAPTAEKRALPADWTGAQVACLLEAAFREGQADDVLRPDRGHVCMHTIVGLAQIHLEPRDRRLVFAVVRRRIAREGPTQHELAHRFGYRSRKGLQESFERACGQLARRINRYD